MCLLWGEGVGGLKSSFGSSSVSQTGQQLQSSFTIWPSHVSMLTIGQFLMLHTGHKSTVVGVSWSWFLRLRSFPNLVAVTADETASTKVQIFIHSIFFGYAAFLVVKSSIQMVNQVLSRLSRIQDVSIWMANGYCTHKLDKLPMWLK